VGENAFVVHFPDVAVLRNTGLNVRYRLDSKLRRRNDTDFVPGELTDKYETNVPLGPEDPTGLYVFNIVLVPTNELDTGIAVLPSVATVGVLRVSSPLTNTVAAVPWMSMAKDEARNEDISVPDVVNPNGISADDMILSYASAAGRFSGWAHGAGTAWNALTTVTKDGISLGDPESTQFPRGGAFWLVRSAPGGSFHLVGRYTGDDYMTDIAGGSTENPVSTLAANPTMYAVALNDLAFTDASGNAATPGADDTIVFNTDGSASTVYVRNDANTAWGRWQKKLVGGRVRTVWVEDGVAASGTGFWYIRRTSGDLKAVWPRGEE
jgi:hypothetical protein